MRINIEIPTASTSASVNHLPPALAQLTPGGELVLIELQGSLEYDDSHDTEGGQLLGKLEFHNGREDKPTLLISHHRLEGKIVTLTKPYAVLEKKKRSITSGDEEHRSVMKSADVNKGASNVYSSPMREAKRNKGGFGEGEQDESIELLNDDDDDDDENQGPVSPSMARKRARLEQTPLKTKGRDAMASMGIEALSSSPMPRAPMRGSELDFSSPLPTPRRPINEPDPLKLDNHPGDKDAQSEEWLHKKNTAVYYELVSIIRKKVLFSKRPEPVVRLDGEGGEKARVALGLAAH